MVPVNSIIRFFVMISTAPPLASRLFAVAVLRVLAFAVPIDVPLLARSTASAPVGNVLRDHRPGARDRALPDANRCHQHGIRTDARPVPITVRCLR